MAQTSICPHCGALANCGDDKRLTCASCQRPLASPSKTVARAGASQRGATVHHGVSRGLRKICGICQADVTFTARRKLEDGTYICEACDRSTNYAANIGDFNLAPLPTCNLCGAELKSTGDSGICEACEARKRKRNAAGSSLPADEDMLEANGTRSSMRWIAAGIGAAVLSIGIATWIILTPRWEEAHLNEIVSMRQTAMGLYGAKKPVESYHAFQSLFAFIGDHKIKNAYVLEQVDSARATMQEVYAEAQPVIEREEAEARAREQAAETEARAREQAVEAAAQQRAADAAALQEKQERERAAQELAAEQRAKDEQARAELAARQAIAKALFARSTEHTELQSRAKSIVNGLQTDLIGEDSAYRSISARAKATRELFAVLIRLQGQLSGSNVNEQVDQIVNSVDRDLIGEDSAIRATYANDQASLKLLGVWCSILSRDFPSLPAESDKVEATADRDTAGDDSAIRAIDAYSSAMMNALRLIASSICGAEGPDAVMTDVSIAQIGEDSAWRSAMKNCDGSMKLLLLILDHDGGDQSKRIRDEAFTEAIDDDSALRVQSQYRQGMVDAVAALIENR
jgi:hypothetical protein